ncbi:aspartyl protease family protein [Gloeobacter kilaueensis]|nr:aspartyl protease family protein [Gloeobacter kilaueensis]
MFLGRTDLLAQSVPDHSKATATTEKSPLTTIPFERGIFAFVPVVKVKINDQESCFLAVDSGAYGVQITPELAYKLKLPVKPREGGSAVLNGLGDKQTILISQEAYINSIKIRDIELTNIKASISALPLNTSEIDGLLGSELFENFVVQLNYDKYEILLFEPKQFSYRGNGITLPITFASTTPIITAKIDGLDAQFNLDTGSSRRLTLFKPFINRFDLRKRYPKRIEVDSGQAIGGPTRAELTRANLLKLGNIEIHRPLIELTLQKGGFATSFSVDGNIGAGLLQRFNTTFDYKRQQLILEKNSHFNDPFIFVYYGMAVFPKTGLVTEIEELGLFYRAGIRKGDKIVAIDGFAFDKMKIEDYARRLDKKLGDQIRMTVQRGDQQREVVITVEEAL